MVTERLVERGPMTREIAVLSFFIAVSAGVLISHPYKAIGRCFALVTCVLLCRGALITCNCSALETVAKMRFVKVTAVGLREVDRWAPRSRSESFIGSAVLIIAQTWVRKSPRTFGEVEKSAHFGMDIVAPKSVMKTIVA